MTRRRNITTTTTAGLVEVMAEEVEVTEVVEVSTFQRRISRVFHCRFGHRNPNRSSHSGRAQKVSSQAWFGW